MAFKFILQKKINGLWLNITQPSENLKELFDLQKVSNFESRIIQIIGIY